MGVILSFAIFISSINVRVGLGLGFGIGYIYIYIYFFFTKTIVTEAPVMFVKPKFLRLCGNKLKHKKGGLGPLSFLVQFRACRYVIL